jgi:hypothetical protein
MPWEDRIRSASYTDPTGRDHAFDFVDVSRVTDKRTTAFNFIGVDESYVQDNGYGSRKYGMQCFFTGDDHDLDATIFEAGLLLPGVGTLNHPLYGIIDVVPFGTIKRSNALVRGANQSIVSVTFWTTTGVVYPTAERSPKSEVLGAINEFDIAAQQAYADQMDVDDTSKSAKLRGTVTERLSTINATLRKPAEATEKVTREFNAWQATINRSINVLVGNPVLLATQLGNLIKAPASAIVGIGNRLTSYVDFLRATTLSPAGSPWDQPSAASQPRRQTQIANDWATADMTAMYGLVATALAAVETEYQTRPEALEVANVLLSELDTMAAWRDQGYAVFTGADFGSQIQMIDDGRAWAAASNTMYLCAGYLVSVAFTLATERTMVLDRPRTIIDLAGELYGDVSDERLNFLISSNDLTGSEILELPRGHEIVWYPA